MPYYAIVEDHCIVNVAQADAALADNWELLTQAGAGIGWTRTAAGLEWGAPPPPAVEVPPTVTRAQGKAALIQAGHWSAVLAFVSAIEDETQRALAEVALHDTLEWRRDSPFLGAAADGVGLTPAQLDALFVAADAIQL